MGQTRKGECHKLILWNERGGFCLSGVLLLGSFKRQAYKNEENTDCAYVEVFGFSGYQNEGTVLLQQE